MTELTEVYEGVVATTTSLALPDSTPFDDYHTIVQRILTRQDCGKFWIGDLILEGRRLYGDHFMQAFDLDGAERYRQYERVSETVPSDLRREEIPWYFYRALPYRCPLEVLAELVNTAVSEAWDFTRWTEAIADYKGETPRSRRTRDWQGALEYCTSHEGEVWERGDTDRLRGLLGA